MASIFVKATNTGTGFITQADRLAFTLNCVGIDIYEVSGSYQTWVSRVNGVEVTGYAQVIFQRALEDAVQKHLDDAAKLLGYDGILSVCTYATSSVSKFRTEALSYISWRDNVWSYCNTALASVHAGTRLPPIDATSFILELPIRV